MNMKLKLKIHEDKITLSAAFYIMATIFIFLISGFNIESLFFFCILSGVMIPVLVFLRKQSKIIIKKVKEE